MKEQPATTTIQRWTIIVLILVCALRAAAAYGDLEIDEIWSMSAAFEMKSVFHILLQFHDNNHIVNTTMLYCLGPGLPDDAYRIPSVLASVASVIFAGLIARRQSGNLAALAVVTLVGTSHVLVLYGAEARGYTYAVLFAYVAWWSLLRLQADSRWSDAAIFAISGSLGFLSHLTFLYAYAGFCVWTIWKWVRKPNWIMPLAHVLPMLVMLAFYLIFIPRMVIGGGPETTMFVAISSSLSIIMGGPLLGQAALIMAAICAVVLVVSFISAVKTDLATTAFYVMSVIITPTAVLIVTGHSLVYPRYFTVSIAFGLLMMGETAARWWPKGGSRRSLVVAFFGIYLAGNLWWDLLILDHGRGDYSHAVQWMVQQDQGKPATISSDHDFRNGAMIMYHANQFPPGQFPLQFVFRTAVPPEGTDWKLLHNFDGDKPFPDLIADPSGVTYQLQRVFHHHGLAGWNWWIYRRSDRASQPSH